MKHLSYLAFFALLLSGCGNLYGPYNAPVVDRNIRYGQPPVRDINQPQQPRVSRKVVSTQVVRQPTGAAPVPAPVVGQQPVAQGNPYRPAPAQAQGNPYRPAPQPNNNGWNAKPQTGNPVVIVDEPKVGKPAAPSVPAAPVVRKPAEKPQQPLVDEPKLAPAPAQKKETTPAKPQETTKEVAKETAKEAPKKPANAVPDAPKVVKKSEAEPEKPKRPAPLRPKTTSNTLEDSVVEKAPTRRQTEEVATRTPTPAPTGKTAASSLLKKAADSLSKGRLDEAVAYLENAQRIEPKNSKILYDIANIRYHQGRYRDAENFAGKASQLGGGSMAKKSWRLISKAREALGDKQGALQAAERAAQ